MRFNPVLRGILVLCAVAATSGCALFIPDNPSEPRYNKVVGERHAPLENQRSMRGAQGASMAAPVDAVQEQSMMVTPPPPESAQPMAVPTPTAAVAPAPEPVTAMSLPPVDANTQRLAQSQIQQDSGLQAAAARSMPEENRQYASSEYPVLNNVPPTPPRPSTAQMNAMRTQLEQDRASAMQAKDQLSRDAAAEPSMLNNLSPAVTVPPADAIRSTPIGQPGMAPLPAAQPAPVPAITPMPQAAPAMPPQSSLPPPPAPLASTAMPPAMAPMPMASAPAPIQMDAMPMATAAAAPATGGLEPIQLRAPMPSMAQAPAPAFAATPVENPGYRSAPPAAGAFDPMAGASRSMTQSGTTVATNSYLPASRYSYRR